MMVIKLSVALSIVLFACCARASLDKLGDLGKGEEGFYRHCFAKQTLENLMIAYHKYPVADQLAQDRDDLIEKMDWEYMDYGDLVKDEDGCSTQCYHKLVKRESVAPVSDLERLNETMCRRYAKFKRECEFMREQKSGDARSAAIEEYLCQTTKDYADKFNAGYFDCQDDPKYPNKYRRDAEQYFSFVASASLETLDLVKAYRTTVDAEMDDLKRNGENLIAEQAYSKVNVGLEHLPEYIECSRKERIGKAEELSKLEEQQSKELMAWLTEKMESNKDNEEEEDDEYTAMIKMFAEYPFLE